MYEMFQIATHGELLIYLSPIIGLDNFGCKIVIIFSIISFSMYFGWPNNHLIMRVLLSIHNTCLSLEMRMGIYKQALFSRGLLS